MAIKETTSLVFDNRLGYGSPEHFFHFFWGYLLPALHLINGNRNENGCQYLFESCGPIMDKITKEVMAMCKVEYAIHADLAKHKHKWIVPRWDIYFLQPLIIDNQISEYEDIQQIQDKLSQFPELALDLTTVDFLKKFTTALHNTRDFITKRLEKDNLESGLLSYKGAYLILTRSAQPRFYSKWFGSAKIPGYGAARRALVGVDKAAEELSLNGFHVKPFEPGKVSLKHQIKIFEQCKGIIGIKGAEFANLIWLSPKSLVILIKPTSMATAPVQRCMAKVFDLKYVEIESDEGMFPRLAPELIVKYLESK